MSAATQIGQAWALGFGATDYTGFMVDDLEVKPDADEEVVKDGDNATASIITYDAKTILTATFLIKSGSSIVPPAKNSIVSLKGPSDVDAVKRRVQDSSAKFSRGITRLSLTLVREDSMAAAYDLL